VKVKHFRPFFGNYVNICLDEKRLVLPVKLTQSSLDAVSDDRVANLLADGKTQPRTCRRRILPEQQEMRSMKFECARVELSKLRTPAQSFILGKNRAGQAVLYLVAMPTARRLRPLALLLLITRRPFLVAMRTRKPWVLFLEILEGWNVLFIFINSLSVMATFDLKVSMELKHIDYCLSRHFC
jgi:hypothetical protein